jgi:hypothetical protein
VGADEGYFGERVAAIYDEHSAGMFDPAVVGPAVEMLAELAGDGAAGVRDRDWPDRAAARRARGSRRKG